MTFFHYNDNQTVKNSLKELHITASLITSVLDKAGGGTTKYSLIALCKTQHVYGLFAIKSSKIAKTVVFQFLRYPGSISLA